MRVAAVDFGLKRIGLAVSDESRSIALPLTVVAAGRTMAQSAANVLAALSPYRLERIFVGLPLLMSGKKGEMAQAAEQFADALRSVAPCPVKMIDERLSSAQVERSLKEMEMSRKERSGKIDAAVAALLLQTVLEQEMHF